MSRPRGSQSGIRAVSVTTPSINNPSINRLNKDMARIFSYNNGTSYTINPVFIAEISKSLTPIITANVIKTLSELGCIDQYCYYYVKNNNNCCGDNNVKDLNDNLKNFFSSSNVNDNDFSLLSTEIFEEITSEINEQIQSIESIELNSTDENENENKNENENENENEN